MTHKDNFVETHNLLVARVLVKHGQSFLSRVLNPGDSNVRIEKGTVIALLEEVVEYNSDSSDPILLTQRGYQNIYRNHL